jgi:quinol monooxygenase YgiN
VTLPAALILRFPVIPARRADFLRLQREFATDTALLSRLPLTQLEFVFRGLNRRGQFVVFECFQDAAALDAVRGCAEIQELIRKLTAFCNAAPEIEYLGTVDSGDSLFEKYPAGKSDPGAYPDLGEMTMQVR